MSWTYRPIQGQFDYFESTSNKITTQHQITSNRLFMCTKYTCEAQWLCVFVYMFTLSPSQSNWSLCAYFPYGFEGWLFLFRFVGPGAAALQKMYSKISRYRYVEYGFSYRWYSRLVQSIYTKAHYLSRVERYCFCFWVNDYCNQFSEAV